jgi:hypothetical protein
MLLKFDICRSKDSEMEVQKLMKLFTIYWKKYYFNLAYTKSPLPIITNAQRKINSCRYVIKIYVTE